MFPKKYYRWPADTWKDANFVITREMQIKATTRYHLTPVRMATDKKTTNNKRQCECRNNLVPCWQDHKTVRPRPETAWKSLNKLEESYNPAIPLLGIFPKKIKTLIGKDVIPMSTKVLFTRAKIRKQPKCRSIEDWKESVVGDIFYPYSLPLGLGAQW